ncbi:LytR C-terminal domain-containing protein [Candidatus Nomurabacteria bacterium]|uniref:LytR C-terminal domain-containing protein n=1 Tax=candidate division WWE3 bacterium TaxID=2053526 RepID=A0A955E1N2_UNCKA|nr:LytR C-terminal domain-containing protein [candidate division WWE3 bacterium]MCB9823693.1 LytR C-terminal domain-containing protein [Candidatus Nomurabacteria bacterium]MCB9827229.1 LytR C-terminal domain-containing protein [Candidatus Nomurabacteria bacterium]MCB9827488.1 LytR C-terminal domain-containing protein [Candidatus Nomurabacteria bacterium]HXK52517.1 LytR C-terminal domain-containing protein [bacterium]
MPTTAKSLSKNKSFKAKTLRGSKGKTKASALKRNSRSLKIKSKSTYKNKKIAKKRSFASYFPLFVLFVASLVILSATVMYKNYLQGFASASSISAFSLQDTDIFSAAVVYVDSMPQLGKDYTPDVISAVIYIYDTNNMSINVFNIDNDLEIDMPGRLGDDTLEKIYALSLMITNGDTAESDHYIKHSLSRLIGFPIDRLVVASDEDRSDVESLLLRGAEISPLLIKDINLYVNEVSTDLTKQEILYIAREANKSQGNISEIDLTSDLSQSSDSLIQEITFGSEISVEGKTVAVLNGTTTVGAANDVARAIENMGGRVITVGNADRQHDTTTLLIDDPDSAAARGIYRFFDISDIRLKDNPGDIIDAEVNRADIVFIVGVDMLDQL